MGRTSCHQYRLAPELRRSCWYVIVGAMVLIPVFYWVARFVQLRGPVDVAVGCSLFGLLGASMFVPLRWRVRLDQHGVSRRLLFRWDLWSWSTLASGRVDKLHPFRLHDPHRPWWRRRLALSYLASGDLQEVIAKINAHYKLPPPPELEDTLTFKYGFRRQATFDRSGLQLMVHQRHRAYAWRDVREVHITRMDPLRRDFASVVITLPDEELELKLFTHQGGTSPTWRGATAEEINEFLLQFVHTDRIHISIAGQPLTKLAHIEKQLSKKEQETRQLTTAMVVIVVLVLGLIVWTAFTHGLLLAAAVGAKFTLFPGTLLFYVYRERRAEISRLTAAKPAGEAIQAPVIKA